MSACILLKNKQFWSDLLLNHAAIPKNAKLFFKLLTSNCENLTIRPPNPLFKVKRIFSSTEDSVPGNANQVSGQTEADLEFNYETNATKAFHQKGQFLKGFLAPRIKNFGFIFMTLIFIKGLMPACANWSVSFMILSDRRCSGNFW